MEPLVGRNPNGNAEGERAPVRVAANRRTFSLPWVGILCLVIALGLLLIGVARHINLLMLLGDLLVMIVLWNLLAAGRSLRELQIRFRFDEWLFARTPCVVEIQVSNPDQHPRFGLRIDEEGPKHAAVCRIDCLPAQGRVSWRRQVTLPRPGRYTWGAVWASSGYPFGLVERRRLLRAESTVMQKAS